VATQWSWRTLTGVPIADVVAFVRDKEQLAVSKHIGPTWGTGAPLAHLPNRGRHLLAAAGADERVRDHSRGAGIEVRLGSERVWNNLGRKS
jgi:hypothetical protein